MIARSGANAPRKRQRRSLQRRSGKQCSYAASIQPPGSADAHLAKPGRLGKLLLLYPTKLQAPGLEQEDFQRSDQRSLQWHKKGAGSSHEERSRSSSQV